MDPRLDPLLLVRKDDLEELKKITKHRKQFVTTLTLGKKFIESGNWTTTLADEMMQEYFKTFDRLLAKFDRRFTDNLPVLSTLEAYLIWKISAEGKPRFWLQPSA